MDKETEERSEGEKMSLEDFPGLLHVDDYGSREVEALSSVSGQRFLVVRFPDGSYHVVFGSANSHEKIAEQFSNQATRSYGVSPSDVLRFKVVGGGILTEHCDKPLFTGESKRYGGFDFDNVKSLLERVVVSNS